MRMPSQVHRGEIMPRAYRRFLQIWMCFLFLTSTEKESGSRVTCCAAPPESPLSSIYIRWPASLFLVVVDTIRKSWSDRLYRQVNGSDLTHGFSISCELFRTFCRVCWTRSLRRFLQMITRPPCCRSSRMLLSHRARPILIG